SYTTNTPSTLPDLHSFPTRRSSDLVSIRSELRREQRVLLARPEHEVVAPIGGDRRVAWDRRKRALGPVKCCRRSEVSLGIEELRSEEHTSELQSRGHLVCRLLLEKK